MLAFVLGGVVIAIAGLVWYLVATDGARFWRSAPTGPSVTIELPAAPAPEPTPVPAEPAAPAAPAD
ncbi:hypothetical protein [Alkalilacustris brevis]|uniref:hypothetical protein n=1 Tax=Alkalilacustris brevis TaxID=2026338 RepID=UPI00138F9DBD|nr:hypothetical protein [Alkalilacustris brevis]